MCSSDLEDPDDPFDIDDVAGAVVAKLVRRHPHVFADGSADSAAEVEASWETIKAGERAAGGNGSGAGDAGVLHGIPVTMPALARAAKVVSRLGRSGRDDLLDDVHAAAAAGDPGARLLALVAQLQGSGVDPDAALRATLRELGRRGSLPAPTGSNG